MFFEWDLREDQQLERKNYLLRSGIGVDGEYNLARVLFLTL